MPDTVARLRAQAEQCLWLAKTCTETHTREALTVLAADSLERASNLAIGLAGLAAEIGSREKPPQRALCGAERGTPPRPETTRPVPVWRMSCCVRSGTCTWLPAKSGA